MRTGTRTVRAPSLMTSPPAMISGRLERTASRTFSSWRSQSRAPSAHSSYHFLTVRGAVLVVAVFAHQTLLHHRDLLARFLVGPRRRGHESQHVAALLEEILL